MKFIYLIQGSADNLIQFNYLKKQNSDVISLSYDKEIPENSISWKNIFLPKSTWAEGRNKLLSEVFNSDFDYIIFLDDDVKVAKGSFGEFERLLSMYKPSIGLPLCDVIKNSHRHLPQLKIQRPVGLDQLMQAYSKDVVYEAKVLPFVTDFDANSWWISCEINQYLILSQYPNNTIQFNEIEVINSGHSWDDEQETNPSSIYVPGINLRDLENAKTYISKRFSVTPALVNSLFHNNLFPKWTYGPKLTAIVSLIFNRKSHYKLKIRYMKLLLSKIYKNSINLAFNSKNIIHQLIIED